MDEIRLASIVPYMKKYYKRGAARRSFEWNLTLAEFVNIILQNCHYCGQEPQFKTFVWGSGIKRSVEKVNGIDRIDGAKHYSKQNCVPCCTACNRMKTDATLDEFINHIFRIATFQGRK